MSSLLLNAVQTNDPLLLQDLLRRLAREMRIAASVADDCQDAIGDDERLDLAFETVARLQGLDLLSQQLVEIGQVLDMLASEGVDGDVPPSVLANVRLFDLQQRLIGQAGGGIRVVDPELW